jgi:hypothetical protein
VEVNAERELLPAERQHGAQVRRSFDRAFPRAENLIDVWIASQKFPKGRLDKYTGSQIGPPSFQQM